MTFRKPHPRVALIYPPFGPPHLASLGLAVLSAGIKQRGFECRTFYWSYRIVHQLPGVPPEHQAGIYHLFTQRAFSPWNEWVFTRHLFGDRLAPRDAEALTRLADLDQRMEPLTRPLRASQIILGLCNNMGTLLSAMADELAAFDIIGVGSTFFQNGAALALCKTIKDRWPDKITLLGGANCDGDMGGGQIDNFPFLDGVFSGEVDHDVPDFVQRVHEGRPIDTVKGLLYRDEAGQVQRGPASTPLDDMNGLPVPDFDDWIEERKRFGMYDLDKMCLPLESSRGCWWGAKSHCTFCGLNANGMAYRQKDASRFQDELLGIVSRYGARFFFMADNILSTQYFKTFVPWAKAHDIKLDFFYEIKANMNRQQLADLADAGISMVQPGIEHFSSSVLSLMRKGVSGIQNVAFLKYAAEHGIVTIYGILAGFPGEDPNEYARLVHELPKLVHFTPPSALIDIEFHRFSPYHNDPASFGIRLRPHEKYSFIYPLPESELARLAYQFEVEGRRAQDLSYLTKISRVVTTWQHQFNHDECVLTWQQDERGILIRDRRPGFAARDYRLSGHAVPAFLALEQPRTLKAAIEQARQIAAEPVSLHASHPTDAARELVGAASAAGSRGAASTARRSGRDAGASGTGTGTDSGSGNTTIAFTAEAFAADPAGCLAPLATNGLLFEDEGRYLNLPVRSDYKKVSGRWTPVLIG
jgi:ribosomal peptide maturation radical SAM protein 1